MKNIATLFSLIVGLWILLLGCSHEFPNTPGSSTPEVTLHLMASTNIVADVVRNVTGEEVPIEALLSVGSDPHTFEPAPQDLAKLSEADLVFLNGAGLEASLEKFLDQNGSPRRLVSLSDGIPLIHFQGGEDEHEAENEHKHVGEYDPHVWMDPNNVLIWVEHILAALVEVDPTHASIYRANAQMYRQKLIELDAWIREQVALIPIQNRLLVSDHMVLGYFAQRYDFHQVGAIIPSISTLSEPSAQDVAALEEEIVAQKIKAIFVGVGFNPALAERLARDTGVQVVFIYTESLSEAAGPAATYLEYMRYNVSAIVSALQ